MVYILSLVPEELIEPVIFILQQTRLMYEQSSGRVVEMLGFDGQFSNGVEQNIGWAKRRKMLVRSLPMHRSFEWTVVEVCPDAWRYRSPQSHRNWHPFSCKFSCLIPAFGPPLKALHMNLTMQVTKYQ